MFLTHLNKPTIDVTGTHLQGTIQASLTQLFVVFGAPLKALPGGDNINYIWHLEFADGAIATVYDWNRACTGPHERVTWNIGGKSIEAVGLVHDAFRAAHDFKARSVAA